MRKWQVSVAGWLIVLAVVVVGYGLAGVGYMRPMFDGFALASDVQQAQTTIAGQVQTILRGQQREQVTSLETEIESVQERKCKAEKDSPRDDNYISELQGHVNDLLNKYYDLTDGRAYPLIGCNQL